jgi:pilus assembly protein CpaE
MLKGLIISSDPDLADRFEIAARASKRLGIVRVLDRYPDGVTLSRLLRVTGPQVIFLGSERIEHAPDLLNFIETNAPGMQVVAISRTREADALLEAMRAGIREFVALPFEAADVLDMIARVSGALDKRPPEYHSTNRVFSFLPSKAGVGASTTAVNVALALARQPGASVALSDFDLNSGMVRFMLKLTNEFSVINAVEHASDMDEALWPQLVTSMSGLDVLHAGRVNPNFRIDGEQIRNLIEFMRRNYDALCFDLSGNLEKYSLEIMQESKRILLVCTPEVPSLHLAKEKFEFLKSLELDDRVNIVLNRVSKNSVISAEHIEDILGRPVSISFPNDYHGVHRALTAGRAVEPSSELGRGFVSLANTLANNAPARPPAAPAKKRFVDFFSVVPNRATAHK